MNDITIMWIMSLIITYKLWYAKKQATYYDKLFASGVFLVTSLATFFINDNIYGLVLVMLSIILLFKWLTKGITNWQNFQSKAQ